MLTENVIAYITSGADILVFKEPDFPDAGVQVPGRTLDFLARCG
jgi:hypothetical protein